jgi:hypothetical protein
MNRRLPDGPVAAHAHDFCEVAVGAARAELAAVFGSYRVDQLDTLFDFFARVTTALRSAVDRAR